MERSKALEALLFISGEPVSMKNAARLLECAPADINEAAAELTLSLAERGVRLIRHDDTLTLSTAPEYSEIATQLA